MVVSRQFGTTGDFIDTTLSASKGVGDNFTFCAWVRLDAGATSATQLCVAGHEANGTGNGFEVYLVRNGSTDTTIRFRPGNGHGSSDATVLGEWGGVAKFIAIVNDSGANELRFYHGTLNANIALHTTLTARVLNSPANCNQFIGARRTSTPSVNEPFEGRIQKIALFYDQILNLTQIKEVAQAETTLHASIATYYYLMEGLDPEPDTSPNNRDGDVTGTTITAAFADPGVATSLAVTGSATETAGRSQTVTITANDAGYSGDKNLIFSGASVSADRRPLGSPTARDKNGVDQPFGTTTVVTFVAGVGTAKVFLKEVETAVISVTDGTISSSGGGNLTVAVSAPTVVSNAGPIMFDTAGEMGFIASGESPNTLAIYPKAILWYDPDPGDEVLIENPDDGKLLFHATADSLGASQYVKFKKGGIKWLDFIVTQIDSGQLFIWY